MEQITPKKEWSVAIRYNHWIMAVLIFVLIATGFYIAEGIPLSNEADVREMTVALFLHILFGLFLVYVFIWRVYLMFFSRFHADWKDFFAFTNIKNFIKQIKFYLLISKEPPEHTHLYGPLQSLAYGGLLAMVFLIVVTGLILTGAAGYHGGLTGIFYKILKPVETMMGGLAIVRLIHHILTWCFVLFIVVHIYMAFWYDVIFKEGTVSSMISGLVFRKEHK
jgi:Ni/Fe-hydrogenase 1 B-type cytochrome subunit